MLVQTGHAVVFVMALLCMAIGNSWKKLARTNLRNGLIHSYNIFPPRLPVKTASSNGKHLSASKRSKQEPLALHSVHCYFLQNGLPDRDAVYRVKRLRDGRSFSSRFVMMLQNDLRFTLMASFHKPEASKNFEYFDPMPAEGWETDPTDLPSSEELVKMRLEAPDLDAKTRTFLEAQLKMPRKVDIRGCLYGRGAASPRRGSSPRGGGGRTPSAAATSTSSVGSRSFGGGPGPAIDVSRDVWWFRMAHPDTRDIWRELPDDDMNAHRLALAYMTDLRFLFTSLTPLIAAGQNHEKKSLPIRGTLPKFMVSLDHSIWFHATDGWRADRWLLFEARCHVAGGSRATIFGKIWDRGSGRLIASCTQEGLIRLSVELPREIKDKLPPGPGYVGGGGHGQTQAAQLVEDELKKEKPAALTLRSKL